MAPHSTEHIEIGRRLAEARNLLEPKNLPISLLKFDAEMFRRQKPRRNSHVMVVSSYNDIKPGWIGKLRGVGNDHLTVDFTEYQKDKMSDPSVFTHVRLRYGDVIPVLVTPGFERKRSYYVIRDDGIVCATFANHPHDPNKINGPFIKFGDIAYKLSPEFGVGATALPQSPTYRRFTKRYHTRMWEIARERARAEMLEHVNLLKLQILGYAEAYETILGAQDMDLESVPHDIMVIAQELSLMHAGFLMNKELFSLRISRDVNHDLMLNNVNYLVILHSPFNPHHLRVGDNRLVIPDVARDRLITNDTSIIGYFAYGHNRSRRSFSLRCVLHYANHTQGPIERFRHYHSAGGADTCWGSIDHRVDWSIDANDDILRQIGVQIGEIMLRAVTAMNEINANSPASTHPEGLPPLDEIITACHELDEQEDPNWHVDDVRGTEAEQTEAADLIQTARTRNTMERTEYPEDTSTTWTTSVNVSEDDETIGILEMDEMDGSDN